MSTLKDRVYGQRFGRLIAYNMGWMIGQNEAGECEAEHLMEEDDLENILADLANDFETQMDVILVNLLTCSPGLSEENQNKVLARQLEIRNRMVIAKTVFMTFMKTGKVVIPD